DPAVDDAAHLRAQPEAALELAHRAPGVREQELARLGRVGPLADALEQRQAELPLELTHLHADRRLRQAQLARRPGEAPVARHRGEGHEVRELDVHVEEVKKYLIVTIKTIDFPDSTIRGMMSRMDTSYYALEMLAQDRLDRA